MQFKTDESGQVLVIFSLVITVMLIISAFAIDVGIIYSTKNEYDSVMYAASLAGAKELSGNGNYNDIKNAVDTVITYNNLNPDVFDTTVSDNKVIVSTNTSIEAVFGKIMDYDEYPIISEYTATYTPNNAPMYSMTNASSLVLYKPNDNISFNNTCAYIGFSGQNNVLCQYKNINDYIKDGKSSKNVMFTNDLKIMDLNLTSIDIDRKKNSITIKLLNSSVNSNEVYYVEQLLKYVYQTYSNYVNYEHSIESNDNNIALNITGTPDSIIDIDNNLGFSNTFYIPNDGEDFSFDFSEEWNNINGNVYGLIKTQNNWSNNIEDTSGTDILITVGDILNTENIGSNNRRTAFTNKLDVIINSCSTATWDNPCNERTLAIPIVITNGSNVEIIGFTSLFLEGYTTSGNRITNIRFTVLRSFKPGTGDINQPDYGLIAGMIGNTIDNITLEKTK